MQTILLSILNDINVGPTIDYEREVFALKDGGILSLDWSYPMNAERTHDLPTIVR